MAIVFSLPPWGPAPHLLRLLGLVGHAHQLTHRAGPLPLAPADQLALCRAHLHLYDELFEPDAPTDTEEIMLVLALLPTLEHLATDLELLVAVAPAAGPLALGLRQDIQALQRRHAITEAEVSAWHTCLHSDPENEPALGLAA